MIENTQSAALVSVSIHAVRAADGDGWLIRASAPRETALEDICSGLDRLKAGHRRFLGSAKVAPDYIDARLVRRAHFMGFQRHPGTNRWYPVEEPLPEIAGNPIASDVRLSLVTVLHGSIGFAVEAAGERFTCSCDAFEDSERLFIRFVGLLGQGGDPHGVLADDGCTHFIVQKATEPHFCRLLIRRHDPEGHIDIDVLTDRKELFRQFRALCAAIADHPRLGHDFLCFAGLPDPEYDRVWGEAEAEWKAGVDAGRLTDDLDARDEFVADRVTARVALSPEQLAEVEALRKMFRSLKVPERPGTAW